MSDEGEATSDVAAATQQALARRAGLGDRVAYEELFRRLFPATYRFALRMLDHETALADDAVQEAWVKAWRGLPDFRGTSSFSTWLFSIVSREALEVRRRRRPVAVDSEILEPIVDRSVHRQAATQDPAQSVLATELWETLNVALLELPWRQRASWLLRELEGFSYDEIARVLDTTPGVVRGQLHRARRTLAIRMEQWR
ncbi:RNA polymerase sigma factor [Nocardioides aurantiacus]|uniref:RNA polymerase sigma factor n=1 Tax=Nocardioides aurantiacus TaxID=86796 RepID=UPI00403F823E